MRLSLAVCAMLVGMDLVFSGCSNCGTQQEWVEIPGTLRCLVADITQCSCEYDEFLEGWRISLTVKLKLENNTSETLSLEALRLDGMFSSAEVRARDKTGRIHELTTQPLGRIALTPVEYAVRNLKPGESCIYNVECRLCEFSREDSPDVGLEWFFPSYRAWFTGEMAISKSTSIPCEFMIEVIGNDCSWELKIL